RALVSHSSPASNDGRAAISSTIGNALLPLAPTPCQPPPLRKSALGSGRWEMDGSHSHSHQRRKRCVAHRAPLILRGRASDKRHPYLLKQHPYVPAAHHPQHASSPSSCAPSTETTSPNRNVLLSCSQLHLYYRAGRTLAMAPPSSRHCRRHP
ncbi:hypothetical protein B0H13DRAFT_2168444, partial [Mycena leptocephala]